MTVSSEKLFSNYNKTSDIIMGPLVYYSESDPVSWMMGYHSDYLQTFLRAQNFLLRDDGPLPYEYRHYIAIIASARHCCTFLVKLHENEFLRHSGNPDWLKGIEYAPRKIQDLYEINKILAHQPWLITKDMFTKLQTGLEPWSLSELMHAIMLLAHFHSLCSFVHGCGIVPEVDTYRFTYEQIGTSDCENNSSGSDMESIARFHYLQASQKEASIGFKNLLEKMTSHTEDAASDERNSSELLKQFHCFEDRCEITVPKMRRTSNKSESLHYVKSSDFSYTDFFTHHSVSKVPTFRACDYSWDDHGFSLANRLYAGIGNLLDDKYNITANMSCYIMGENVGIDQSSFHQAIWNYIHHVYGITHDDYDYSEVNQLLERNFKAYIKTATCYPERLQTNDYEFAVEEDGYSVKVHINLVVMEARHQAELLYALRALNQYIT